VKWAPPVIAFPIIFIFFLLHPSLLRVAGHPPHLSASYATARRTRRCRPASCTCGPAGLIYIKPGSSSPATWPDGQQLVEVVGVELACVHGNRGRALRLSHALLRRPGHTTPRGGGTTAGAQGGTRGWPGWREQLRHASRAGRSSSSAASRAGASSSAAAMPTGGNQSAAASQAGASSPAAAMAEKTSSRWCREEQRERGCRFCLLVADGSGEGDGVCC
jgi:hypothetical protein